VNDVLQTHDRSTFQNPAWPPEAVDLLTRVEQLLQEGRPQAALALLPVTTDSPWLRNARGVCLLRLGLASQAVETLRDLVFNRGGFAVRADADPVFQANYATALLLDGNAEGFWSILGGIDDRTHTAVARLDDAVRRWKADMTFWQRFASALGVGGSRFVLDSPPGDL
jgi:predicted Zn-dependent protease